MSMTADYSLLTSAIADVALEDLLEFDQILDKAIARAYAAKLRQMSSKITDVEFEFMRDDDHPLGLLVSTLTALVPNGTETQSFDLECLDLIHGHEVSLGMAGIELDDDDDGVAAFKKHTGITANESALFRELAIAAAMRRALRGELQGTINLR